MEGDTLDRGGAARPVFALFLAGFLTGQVAFVDCGRFWDADRDNDRFRDADRENDRFRDADRDNDRFRDADRDNDRFRDADRERDLDCDADRERDLDCDLEPGATFPQFSGSAGSAVPLSVPTTCSSLGEGGSAGSRDLGSVSGPGAAGGEHGG